MKISDHLKENRVFLGLEASTKEEAIKVMAEKIKGSSEISDFNAFVAEVFERESVSSTAIGEGIGIPHARTNSVNKLIIAMGRFDTPIDFKASDGNPVSIVFLMGTPKDEWVNEYLRFFSYLAKMVYKEEIRDILLGADSPCEIIDAFIEAERDNMPRAK